MSPRKYCLVIATAVLMAGPSSFAQIYTITNMGDLGSGYTVGYGINASGQVVGESCATPSTPHAFGTASTSGIINPATDDKGTMGAAGSYGRGINDSGQVVGFVEGHPVTGGNDRAFRANPGSAAIDLGSLGGVNSFAQGINNAGQVVGYANIGSNAFHAFRTAANAIISPITDDLGDLGGGVSYGRAINNSGQVVGYSPVAGGVDHAFRTTATGKIDASADLGTLAGFFTTCVDINDAGNAVGYGWLSGGLPPKGQRAFFVPQGRAIEPTDALGTLGGKYSYAAGINNANVIVGAAEVLVGATEVSGGYHAAIWYTPSSGAIDINTLLPADSGWVLQEALAINDAGQITGHGSYNGVKSGFVLTPVPEPASLALLLAAAPLLLRRRRAIK